jgi:hypothetical protein
MVRETATRTNAELWSTPHLRHNVTGMRPVSHARSSSLIYLKVNGAELQATT